MRCMLLTTSPNCMFKGSHVGLPLSLVDAISSIFSLIIVSTDIFRSTNLCMITSLDFIMSGQWLA